MEDAMCHDRRSFVSDEQKAKTTPLKEQQDKRSETVGGLLREANEGAQKRPAERPARESVPAK
jgi:cytochrome oxidase assembly protein ShyY1